MFKCSRRIVSTVLFLYIIYYIIYYIYIAFFVIIVVLSAFLRFRTFCMRVSKQFKVSAASAFATGRLSYRLTVPLSTRSWQLPAVNRAAVNRAAVSRAAVSRAAVNRATVKQGAGRIIIILLNTYTFHSFHIVSSLRFNFKRVLTLHKDCL